MGHRANFVVVRDCAASAFEDNWAGLGAALLICDGPIATEQEFAGFEQTDALLDWAFAEGGILLDFDEKLVLVFGELDDLADDEDEYAESDGEGADLAVAKYRAYFDEIAPNWPGWLLRYDDRGVDAFAEHMSKRGIDSIGTEEKSHPADSASYQVQA